MAVLCAQGYPEADIRMDALQEEFLRFSLAIRLPNDLTLVEIRFGRP